MSCREKQGTKEAGAKAGRAGEAACGQENKHKHAPTRKKNKKEHREPTKQKKKPKETYALPKRPGPTS